jgi:hypothetical protein
MKKIIPVLLVSLAVVNAVFIIIHGLGRKNCRID